MSTEETTLTGETPPSEVAGVDGTVMPSDSGVDPPPRSGVSGLGPKTTKPPSLSTKKV